jgi:alpha-glucuronidase
MGRKYLYAFISLFLTVSFATAEDGYELWLRYTLLKDKAVLTTYTGKIKGIVTEDSDATAKIISTELRSGISGILGKDIPVVASHTEGAVIAATFSHPSVKLAGFEASLSERLGDEGYVIRTVKIKGKNCIVIAANKSLGVLYGTFGFLRLLQTGASLESLNIESKPTIKRRILNHWDNLDRTVERGYAGFSIWDWHKLPDYLDQRYYDYARANASIGINGAVLTNVNANALILTPHYLQKVKALADLFRPYGIRVYLTARFSAPIEIGHLPTADPLNADVQRWWKEKAKEIYSYVPDFGGFLVKANSEGQPGPQNYGRNHADGANLLAEAVAPFGGIVMWRAFVYSNEVPTDRVKQAYDEFKPLDGKFLPNVIVQVKNGPLDFQPREPFHPLFGAMKSTPLMMEFQITKEYLGFASHLVYLGTFFKEVLESDTYAKGAGSTVRKVVDGSLDGYQLNAIAGVSNVGNDRNWCGHPFGQANWYAYGRLAWNLSLSAEDIAREWAAMTFSTEVVNEVTSIMMKSHETCVNYMTPLGLHHIMGWSHHYGPGPWIKDKQRADWTSVYYHKADTLGVGFDRTETGSNALEQYAPEVREKYQDAATCPETLLLWFHHVRWDHKMKSGKTLWDEIVHRYSQGAAEAKSMQAEWQALQGKIDPARHRDVTMLLQIQASEAKWWRDACISYFQSFSRMPIPAGLEKPEKSLEEYKAMEFPYAPGIRWTW